MNELELKYGCNPNQKPARIFMRDGGELPITVLNGKPGLHQLSGRAELLAAGAGTEGGHRPARRRLLQARLPRRRRRGPAPQRRGAEDLLCGAWTRSSPPSPAPISGPGARTGCAPTATGRPSPTCATPPPPGYLKLRGLRRHHRPRLHRRGPGDPEDQEKGQLQRGADRPGLRPRPPGVQGRVRRHLRAGPEQL